MQIFSHNFNEGINTLTAIQTHHVQRVTDFRAEFIDRVRIIRKISRTRLDRYFIAFDLLMVDAALFDVHYIKPKTQQKTFHTV